MILAFDTYYLKDKARTVAVQFENWNDSKVSEIYEETLGGINDYVSGQFYKRELPCILSLLDKIDLSECNAIVVDGFVYLDDEFSLGLGGHLYNSLEKIIPVLGVAKNKLRNINLAQRPIYRGVSKKALFVTAVGIDLEKASALVVDMFGDYRIPDILKEVDGIGRRWIETLK